MEDSTFLRVSAIIFNILGFLVAVFGQGQAMDLALSSVLFIIGAIDFAAAKIIVAIHATLIKREK